MGLWRTKPQQQQIPAQAPTTPTDYPSGIVVRTESGYYLIRKTIKLKFLNERVFNSWKLTAYPSTDAAISKYIKGGTLGFRDSSLIKNIADGKMYLIADSKRRHIKSPEVFDRLALRREFIEASDQETKIHAEGEPLE